MIELQVNLVARERGRLAFPVACLDSCNPSGQRATPPCPEQAHLFMHSEHNDLSVAARGAHDPLGDIGRKRFVTVTEALDDAGRRASEIPLRKSVLDFLYEKRRDVTVDRPEWERQVRVATAFDENLTRFGSPMILKRIGGQIDAEVKAAIIRDLTSSPTLAIGYHGGFSVSRRKLFARLFPDGVVIGASGKHAAHDGAYALFAAREALLQGKPVLMAPDGRFGKEAGIISVLGANLPVTDGAPFLAHATGCGVLWFALVWTGSAFTLKILRGPQREHGEAFPAYRERFYCFYADRLEEAFTCDPANLPLSQNWRLIFGAMLAGKTYTFRRSTR